MVICLARSALVVVRLMNAVRSEVVAVARFAIAVAVSCCISGIVTSKDIVGRTVGESEKDTHPPVVRTRRLATMPRLAGRTLGAVVTTIMTGQVNDRGKGVILDKLIMQILIL